MKRLHRGGSKKLGPARRAAEKERKGRKIKVRTKLFTTFGKPYGRILARKINPNNITEILSGNGRPLKWVRLPIQKVTQFTKGVIYPKRTHDKPRWDKGIKRGPNKSYSV